MPRFPPDKWEVRYLKDLDNLSFDPPDDEEIHIAALLAVRPAAGEEGSFRFTLAGSNHLNMLVPVTSILEDEAFNQMFIEAQLHLGSQVSSQYITCLLAIHSENSVRFKTSHSDFLLG